MKRAYRTLLTRLQPHSTIFLGDLFDGGREWSTQRYKSPEERYRGYGQDFWLQEYQRFQDMFVKTWHDAGIPNLPSEGGRRLITSLPGNHDLGFAGGINSFVHSRFEAHFGPTNRIDILGNHTFVALDTVSLSAMDQVDPQTGASGIGDGSAAATRSTKIWKPVKLYLSEAKSRREHLVRQEVRRLNERASQGEKHLALPKVRSKFDQVVEDARSPVSASKSADRLQVSTSQFPTIILSHVPLFRSDADSGACGPLRERGTHIPLSQGYQYQNVLTPLISKDIVEHLDAGQITQIYSGDDHDYCEIEHDEFTGRIREITVKSMSWAMGVRKPGVQLASLWNPVDMESVITSHQSDANAGLVRNMPKHTVQNHLCLLPDQLGIFTRYAELFGLTLAILLVRALLWRPSSSKLDIESRSQFSTTHPDGDTESPPSPQLHAHQTSNDSTSSSTLSTKPITSRRAGTQLNGGHGYSYGNIRVSSRSPSPSKTRFQADSDDWGNPTTASDRTASYTHHHDPNYISSTTQLLAHIISLFWLFRPSRTKTGEFARSIVRVGAPVLAFYLWFLVRDM